MSVFLGKVLIQNIKRSQNADLRIEVDGIINSESIFGDTSISVSKVIFTIPNLRDLLGNQLKLRMKKGS